MNIARWSLSLLILGSAFGSLIGARSAIAGKMVFFASPAAPAFQVKTSFDAENGSLTLNPEGKEPGILSVEIVSLSGRSPASEGKEPLVQVTHLDHPVSIRLPSRVKTSPELLQIRVLAP